MGHNKTLTFLGKRKGLDFCWAPMGLCDKYLRILLKRAYER